jgi:HAMP domain-containing protein
LKLLAKFTVLLALLFGASVAITALIANRFLHRNAREQVIHQAELMMETATATRRYNSEQVKPLLEAHESQINRFLPQTVPAFAAVSSFNYLRGEYPEYSYREVSLNPTNLADRAVDWEADVIRWFRNHPSEHMFMGDRDTPAGRSIYLAKPIKALHSCLECHSTAAVAPPSMIREYGPEHGFGWRENDVVAAQIVSVPTTVPEDIAGKAFWALVTALSMTSLVTVAMVDLALVLLIIRPVSRLAATADRISRGELDVPELPVAGSDEISALTASFNRMYVSLVKAIRMLEG